MRRRITYFNFEVKPEVGAMHSSETRDMRITVKYGGTTYSWHERVMVDDLICHSDYIMDKTKTLLKEYITGKLTTERMMLYPNRP